MILIRQRVWIIGVFAEVFVAAAPDIALHQARIERVIDDFEDEVRPEDVEHQQHA